MRNLDLFDKVISSFWINFGFLFFPIKLYQASELILVFWTFARFVRIVFVLFSHMFHIFSHLYTSFHIFFTYVFTPFYILHFFHICFFHLFRSFYIFLHLVYIFFFWFWKKKYGPIIQFILVGIVRFIYVTVLWRSREKQKTK